MVNSAADRRLVTSQCFFGNAQQIQLCARAGCEPKYIQCCFISAKEQTRL